uniref:Uncharacterized protein n=1 Tax=Cannabis sativa TaxID=3483 RepID=A0A803PM28_CANSA
MTRATNPTNTSTFRVLSAYGTTIIQVTNLTNTITHYKNVTFTSTVRYCAGDKMFAKLHRSCPLIGAPGCSSVSGHGGYGGVPGGGQLSMVSMAMLVAVEEEE